MTLKMNRSQPHDESDPTASKAGSAAKRGCTCGRPCETPCERGRPRTVGKRAADAVRSAGASAASATLARGLSLPVLASLPFPG